MSDSTDNSARAYAAKTILAKRDLLLIERARLAELRSDLLTQQRRNDRDLGDCRAAARFFELDIEFPPLDDVERSLAHRLEIENRMLDVRRSAAAAVEDVRRRRAALVEAEDASAAVEREPVGAAGKDIASGLMTVKPPPVRVIALDQLREASSKGMKAAAIRDHAERMFGMTLHEKTVGMTLYRLSQENLVHRDGHTWFFGPSKTETENPGADTPGQQSIFD